MPTRSEQLAGNWPVPPDIFPDPPVDVTATSGEQRVVLAAGCFWCVEAVFLQLDGVLAVTSGYAGGSAETADYRTVSSGRTEHAEVIEVRYDSSRITFGQILKVFFTVAHDPTQVNRQGPDIGRHYRSAIFAVDDEQRRVAEAYIAEIDRSGVLGRPVATEVAPLEAFYPAEDYHQNYAARNPTQPYIAVQALPKVEKVRKYYGDRLKK